MPTSLAHRYLASLIASGLAVENHVTGLYDFGPNAISRWRLCTCTRRPVASRQRSNAELVAATELTALLNVLGDRGPTIVRWERTYTPFVTTLAVGSVLPLTGSASGRVILAFIPERIRNKFFASNVSESEEDSPAKLAERFVRIRKRGYDTAEWNLVEPLIPPGKRGGDKRTVNLREVVNGLMFILSTGCQWRAIPKDLPPRSTVYDYFDLWSWDGTLDRIHHTLYVKCREAASREASPTAAVIDSQSVKSAEKGGFRLIRRVTTRERRLRARSGTFSSIPKAC